MARQRRLCLSRMFPVRLHMISLISLELILILINVQVQQRGEKVCFDFVVNRSGKKRGVGRFYVLIFWPTVMLWVLRGLEDITKLICPLHRQPCSALPAPPPACAAFCCCYQLAEGPQTGASLPSTCHALGVFFFIQRLCDIWLCLEVYYRCDKLHPHA